MCRGRVWTNEELEFLEDKWGILSISAIAKKLNRTTTSIQIKANRLGLGTFIDSAEYVTFNKFIKAIGYSQSYSYFYKRLVKLGFPIKKKKIVTRTFKVVYLDEFWKWAENNKNDINFANFEKGNLGLEPEWVEAKRKSDRSNPSKITHNRVWTKAHDNTLISMCKSQRYTYKDIARELNRTENAIKRRLIDLGVKVRPLYLNNHVKWTDEENKKMLELHEQGYDTNYIANVLNKSQLSISDRIKKLKDA